MKPADLNDATDQISGSAQKENRRSECYWTEKDSCGRDETHKMTLKSSSGTWVCVLEASASQGFW